MGKKRQAHPMGKSLETRIAKISSRNLMSSICSHSGTSSFPDEQLQSRIKKKKKGIQEKIVLIFRKLETQDATSKHYKFSLLIEERDLYHKGVFCRYYAASELVSMNCCAFLQNISEESKECF